MDTKENLARRLKASRKFTERLLATFTKPEEWLHRVHPTANHAMWIVGHIATVDNNVLGMLRAPSHVAKPEWDTLFGMNSTPQDDASLYPTTEELLAYFQDRREKFLDFLATQTESSLAQPVPAGSPPIFTDYASAFERLAFHEAMHAGQLTVARQSLKHPRVVNFSQVVPAVG